MLSDLAENLVPSTLIWQLTVAWIPASRGLTPSPGLQGSLTAYIQHTLTTQTHINKVKLKQKHKNNKSNSHVGFYFFLT